MFLRRLYRYSSIQILQKLFSNFTKISRRLHHDAVEIPLRSFCDALEKNCAVNHLIEQKAHNLDDRFYFIGIILLQLRKQNLVNGKVDCMCIIWLPWEFEQCCSGRKTSISLAFKCKWMRKSVFCVLPCTWTINFSLSPCSSFTARGQSFHMKSE